MKKSTLNIIIAIILIIIAIGGIGYYFNSQKIQKTTEITEIEESRKITTYESDDLGLTFSYPITTSNGEEVVVVEEENKVTLWTSGKTSSPDATIKIAMIDIPTYSDSTEEHLWKTLLKSSDVCSIKLNNKTEKKEIYTVRTTATYSIVEGFEEDFDQNCLSLIYKSIYYFPDQPSKVVLVSSGQDFAFFPVEINKLFHDSIRLLPE